MGSGVLTLHASSGEGGFHEWHETDRVGQDSEEAFGSRSFDGLQEGEREKLLLSLHLVTEWTWTRKKISNPVLVIGEENYWWMVVGSSQLPEYRRELTSGYLDNQQRGQQDPWSERSFLTLRPLSVLVSWLV